MRGLGKINVGRRSQSVTARNNVHVQGSGALAMVFAYGFGCDQNMWRLIVL
jgi:sigma-B regulation protein RsbQ